jgi:hypothetical protein
MTDAASFTRPCPQCGRNVPRHVRTCRCGAELPELPAIVAPAVPPPSPEEFTRPRVSPVAWVGWGMAGVLAAALVWTVTRQAPSVPQKEPSPTSAAPQMSPPHTTPAKPVDAAVPVTTPAPAPSPPSESAGAAAPSIEDVLSRAMASVVSLRTEAGSGSGFFLSPDTIITNEHVVAGHSTVTVRSHDGVERSGRVVVRQPSVDLATVKLSPPIPQQALPVGRLTDVRVGQEVLAIGSPLGIENTVTRGIVSGIRRVGTVTLLQTDAAVNPGNSGGPLLNRQGEVVGITTLKLSRAEQMSFAVAIEHALPLLSGRPVASSSQPPLSSILPGAPRAESDTDIMRDRAERTFGAALQRAQAMSLEFKGNFDRYADGCNSRIKWQWAFTPRDPAAASEVGKDPTASCRNLWNALTDQADGITSILRQVDERARQGGVLPGVMRDLLARYGLEEVAAVAIR